MAQFIKLKAGLPLKRSFSKEGISFLPPLRYSTTVTFQLVMVLKGGQQAKSLFAREPRAKELLHLNNSMSVLQGAVSKYPSTPTTKPICWKMLE